MWTCMDQNMNWEVIVFFLHNGRLSQEMDSDSDVKRDFNCERKKIYLYKDIFQDVQKTEDIFQNSIREGAQQ